MDRNARMALIVAAATVLATGCATGGGEATTAVKPEAIAVHDNQGPTFKPYTVVRRVWADSWRTAFLVPTYESPDAAKADLQQQAASLGGDAVLNQSCSVMNRSSDPADKQKLLCHGTVVKYAR